MGGEAGASPVYAERATRVERGTPRQRPGPNEEPDAAHCRFVSNVLPPPLKQLTRTR